ncbi:hypothetical protein XBFM1_2050037 [Xenorhabdus bovienii str. feltiae Moldova]|uniref:Uncharacterized protein n=2 Tax=Xenorhabdus bovienii TaxID=40576 RepID=A0A0B6X1U2_XENBV|nr:hypothetical protein XBFM1_2050037 [Xenorhabdus bovienii str. feltiae Moldova]CDM87697.1 protein of unknown function [Xenorhabdus bovienii]
MVGCRKADLIILPGTGHIHTAAGFGDCPEEKRLINEISDDSLIPNK